MKKIFFLVGITLTLTLAIVIVTIQSTNNKTDDKKGQLPKLNLEQLFDKKQTIQNGKREKNGHPEKFIKFHQLIRTRDGEPKPGYKLNYRYEELKSAQIQKSFSKSATVQLDWKERGPGNISGRTRDFIIDPDDKKGNTWFAASVSGGIWKTTNAGNSWSNLTNNFPNLATASLAMAPSNTQVIYAGTGEGYGILGEVNGHGIFKSTDKGETWEQLESTIHRDLFTYVRRIVVDPSDENHLFVAAGNSVQKSTDGGQTWLTVFGASFPVLQIVADPTNFNLLYATVAGTGIIKSADAGLTWHYIITGLQYRIEMALSPTHPNIIYAKDESLNVYSSHDAGNTWSVFQVQRTVGYGYGDNLWHNNALAVSPTDPSVLFMGGVDLYKLEAGPTTNSSSAIVFAYTENTDGFLSLMSFGQNYLYGKMDVNTNKTNSANIEIQFGPGKSQKAHRFLVPEGRTIGVPDSLYAFADYVEVPFEVWDTKINRQLMVSFRDQDRNGVFNLAPFDDDSLAGRDYIWVNDVDYSDSLYSEIAKNGGQDFDYVLNIWPTLAESATWEPNILPESKIVLQSTEITINEYHQSVLATHYPHYYPEESIPYIHADIHNIQFTKRPNGATRIVVANDGGMAFSDDDGKTWANPTNGFNTTQFYGVDKHPTQNRYIGGMQDNSSYVSPENADKNSVWSFMLGGDGFDAVWNAGDPNKVIASFYYNQLALSTDGGKTGRIITYGIDDHGSGNASFLTQIGYSPQQPDKLYLVGKSGVTISEDFGLTWKLTEIPENTWGWNFTAFIEPSNANPDVVWAGSRMTATTHIHVSTDGGESFTAVNSYDQLMGRLTGLAVHPLEENTAYALFSYAGAPKILRTTNLGQSWEDITQFENGKSNNGFPDVAVYTMLVMPHNPNEIWVGTEIGLFISNNNGESWEYAANGLPAVSIWEMKIRGSQVVLATHGRGVWSVDLPELVNATITPQLLGAGTSPSNKTNIRYNLISAFDSVAVMVDNQQEYLMPANSAADSVITCSFDIKLEGGKHTVKLAAFKNGITYFSSVREMFAVDYQNCRTSYSNSFDENKTGFVDDYNGFSIKELAALGEGKALHSPHPYPENISISCYLKVPIIVSQAETNTAQLTYRDIPLVEVGEPGSTFGSEGFYDYVIAEGSVNGIDWLPLTDGYDFNTVKDTADLLGKTINDEPSEAMFIKHSANLLDNFNTNDSLMIRFRLFSDPYTTGWGWVIDDVNIQQPATTVHDFIQLTQTIYPNPCNNQLNIQLKQQFSRDVQLTVYDLLGRKQITQTANYQQNITLNTSHLKPAIYILEVKTDGKVERTKFHVSR